MCMNMEDALEYYYKGLSHQENGNFDDALKCFYKSLEIDEHFKTYHRVYQILKVQEKQNESFTALKKAFQLNMRNDKVASDYAEMLIALNRYKEANEILLSILERNPTYRYANELIALLNAHNNQQTN